MDPRRDAGRRLSSQHYLQLPQPPSLEAWGGPWEVEQTSEEGGRREKGGPLGHVLWDLQRNEQETDPKLPAFASFSHKQVTAPKKT